LKILIAGDTVPTESNKKLFVDGDIKKIFGDGIISVFNDSDFRILNLETPLTNLETPIKKLGPNLLAQKETINGIKLLNPTLLSLANNHIMDQGTEGYHSTLNCLEKNKINFIGIGENLNDIKKFKILEKNNLRIGIYSFTENEFTVATKTQPGANPLDLFNTFDHIKDLKKDCDHVIVLYHGGKEHYRYPTPFQMKVSRKLVESGADVVICQHSHAIGCYERYQNSSIVYGQGNFIFDYTNSSVWLTGLLIEIEFLSKYQHNLRFIPIEKRGNLVRLAEKESSINIISEFNKRSDEIKNESFVEEKFSELVSSKLVSDYYLFSLTGLGKWFARIDRFLFKGKLIDKWYSETAYLKILNYIECETHLETLKKIVNLKLKDKEER